MIPLDRGDRLVIWGTGATALLCLLGLAALVLLGPGCTATGGSCTTDDSCTPLERCDAGRCEPPRPRPAPKGNRALPEPPLPGKTPGGGPSKNVPLKDEV